MRPYGDRHVVGSECRGPSLGEGLERWGTVIRTRKFSVFRVNRDSNGDGLFRA